MYNAQQVRSKQRFAVKRREEDVEQMEIESGEINLIPYLDIVTNLVLFMLASVTTAIIFGQINTQLPDRASGPTQPQPSTPLDEIPLKVVVSVTRDAVVLWSVSGLEGTLSQPKATFRRTGKTDDQCDGDYMCESNRCDGVRRKCVMSTEMPQWVFDYRAINSALIEIANRRYANKARKKETYQAVLMCDPSVPYGTIIATMGAMRCRMPELGKIPETCFLPTDDEKLKKAQSPIDEKSRLYDTERAPYDPTKMALFHDIVFSPGVEQ